MATLEYDFRVVGQDAIFRAFSSIEKRAAQHSAKMDRAFGGTGRPSSGSGRGAPMRTSGVDPALRAKVAAEERAARQIANAKIREERRVASEVARSARWKQQLQNKHYQQEERQRKRQESIVQRSRSRTLGTLGRSVSGATRTVGTLATGALAIGGGFMLSGAVSQQMRETAMASKLANMTGDPKQKAAILKESQQVRGFTGEETMSAMGGFVEKTGDVAAARRAIQDMGKLAIATGTDFGEMGEAAGQAFNVLRDQIKDPEEQIKALNDVMRTLAAQGNMGAVEIKDMAVELASLGAATRKFNGGPAELMKTMGAMAQASVARGGAANAAEASTAVVRFGEDLTKNPSQKALNKMGVNIFADKGKTKLKDPREIMADIMAKTGGDLTKLQDVFNAQSIKAFQGFSPLFLQAEEANAKLAPKDRKKKGEAGRAAMLAEFGRFSGAGMSDADMNARAESRYQDADVQFKEAMKSFNSEMGSKLLPQITKLIPKMAELTPVIGSLIDKVIWLTDKLGALGAVGAVVAAKITADIAAAKIGDAIKGVLTGEATGGQAALGKAGIIGALAVTTMTVGMMVIDSMAAADEEKNRREAELGISGQNASSQAASAISRGDYAGAEKAISASIEAAKAQLASVQEDPGMFKNLFQGLARLGGGDSEAAIKEDVKRKYIEENQLKSFIAEQTEALKTVVAAAAQNRGNAPTVPVVK